MGELLKTIKATLLIFNMLTILSFSSQAQSEVIRLWKDVESMRGKPTKMYYYPAPDSIATGATVIVCPGGSYHHLMGIKTEGYEVAEWLNKQGITAFVLRYRVLNQGYKYPAMIQDAQRALQYLREHADQYQIDTTKIGMMGFSAGGHLALMAGTFYNEDFLSELGISPKVSVKPNYVVAVYPVVSMQDEIAHERSRKCLVRNLDSQLEKDRFSMEKQVNADMPPTFLVVSRNDKAVNYQNSEVLAKSLKEHQVVHTFLLYETGNHGYGMSEVKASEAGKWKYDFLNWININMLH